jgi:hypothetical protein
MPPPSIRSFTSQNPTIATTSSLLVNTVSYHTHQKYPFTGCSNIRQEKDIEVAYVLTQQFIALARNGQGSLFDTSKAFL